METYYGYIKTQLDAILLFEACRLGVLPRVQRRLSERERLQIKSGSIYVWNEAETGMKRWTDGKPWSASRVSGSFLTYREMENPSALSSSKKLKSGKKSETSGMEYKVGGLYKQSFSLTTSDGTKFHLISYYKREDVNRRAITQPTQDPSLKCITIPIDFYPDNASAGNQLGPAVIKGPMAPHISAPIPLQNHQTRHSFPLDPHQRQQQQQHMAISHFYATPPQTSALAPGHVQHPFYVAGPAPTHGPLHFQPQHLNAISASSTYPSTHLHHGPLISPPSQHSPVSSVSSSHSLPPVRFPSPPSSYSHSPKSSQTELDKSASATSGSNDSKTRGYNNAEDKRALQRLDQGFLV